MFLEFSYFTLLHHSLNVVCACFIWKLFNNSILVSAKQNIPPETFFAILFEHKFLIAFYLSANIRIWIQNTT